MTCSTQPHTHISSREASFFSSNPFAKWAYTYLRILLNTGTLTSGSNPPVLWNEPLCSPSSSLSLMGSTTHRVRGAGNWLREGRDIVEQGGDTGQERWRHWDLTFTVVTSERPCGQTKMTCSLQWLRVINFYLSVHPLWWPFRHPVWVYEGRPRGTCLLAKIIWILFGILDLCILGNITRSAYL